MTRQDHSTNAYLSHANCRARPKKSAHLINWHGGWGLGVQMSRRHSIWRDNNSVGGGEDDGKKIFKMVLFCNYRIKWEESVISWQNMVLKLKIKDHLEVERLWVWIWNCSESLSRRTFAQNFLSIYMVSWYVSFCQILADANIYLYILIWLFSHTHEHVELLQLWSFCPVSVTCQNFTSSSTTLFSDHIFTTERHNVSHSLLTFVDIRTNLPLKALAVSTPNKWDMVNFPDGPWTSVPASPSLCVHHADDLSRFVSKITVSVQLAPCNLCCVVGPILTPLLPTHTHTRSLPLPLPLSPI